MNTTAWNIAELRVVLPATYRQAQGASANRPMLDIPGASSAEAHAAWEGPSGQVLSIFFWALHPPCDGGPTATTHEWLRNAAGQTVRVMQTELFGGRSEEVLITYLKTPSSSGVYLICARGMEIWEFDTVLSTLRFNKITPRKFLDSELSAKESAESAHLAPQPIS